MYIRMRMVILHQNLKKNKFEFNKKLVNKRKKGDNIDVHNTKNTVSFTLLPQERS